MTTRPESDAPDELERLRRFVEIADVMLVALAADETILDLNATACNVLGGARADLIGRNWFDTVLPAAVREQVRKMFHEGLTGRTELPEHYVNEIISLDGRRLTIAWRNRMRVGAHGRQIASFSSGNDITQRLAAERALHESERRYREIVQTTDEGVWIIDSAGDTTFANERMAHMLGCTAEQLLGRSLFEFMDAESRSQAERNLQRRREGFREQHEFTFQRVDGTPLHTWITTNPIYDDDGQVIGALGMVTDMTERVRAEEEREQLRAKMEAMQRLESLGVLAGGVAHDFNNLLVGMLGNADLARQVEGLPGFVVERLDAVVEAAERASGLTRQLLDYAGRAETQASVVDLRRQVDAITKLARASISPRVALEVEQDGNDPLWIAVDPDRLHQLVTNLVTNAAESYGDGVGTVVVRARSWAPETDPEAVTVVEPLPGQLGLATLEVKDAGCGMGQATCGRMFEPFFSTKGVGRGLGMSTSVGFVRGAGGGLVVRSAPAAGTSVCISFPVSPPSQEVTAEPTAAEARPAHILVIDDEPMVRSLAATALRAHEHEVDEASSGEEAIARSEGGERYDLLIVDVTMPGLDGEATLVRLRELGHAEPALVCSGYLEQEVLRRFERLQPVAFLHKPYRPNDLAAAVAKLRAADAAP